MGIFKDVMLFSITAPGLILVFILLSIWAGTNKKLSKTKKWTIWILTIVVSYLSTTLVASKPALQDLEAFAPKKAISSSEYDAIAILTGGINKGLFEDASSKVGEQFLKRLISALGLYESSKKPLIILGGKTQKDELAESEIAEKILADLGVPKDKMILDVESRNTYENFVELEKIVKEHKFKKVVLVTSAIHMKRSLNMAQKLGVSVIPYPAAYLVDKGLHIEDLIPSQKNIRVNAILVYELLGNIRYKAY
ncbi:MAG: YdcF family protein [bacterium]